MTIGMTRQIPDNAVDTAAFRQSMRALAGAISVLSVGEGVGRTGLTATSVTSFSVDPPAVAISVNTASSSWRAIQGYRSFCINILSAGQKHVAENFSGLGGVAGPDRYVGANWTLLESGAPVLEGALANIDCALDDAIVRHSHAFVIGRVVGVRAIEDAEPLLYWRGRYRVLAPEN